MSDKLLTDGKPENFQKEIEIRGHVISLGCDLEFSLFSIIVYSSPDPMNQKRKFHKMMMNTKIETAVCDLKAFPSIYKKYEKDLEDLMAFKDLRNSLAHYPMLWEASDPPMQAFNIFHVTKDEHLVRVSHRVDDIYKDLKKYAQLVLKLTLIQLELKKLRNIE